MFKVLKSFLFSEQSTLLNYVYWFDRKNIKHGCKLLVITSFEIKINDIVIMLLLMSKYLAIY